VDVASWRAHARQIADEAPAQWLERLTPALEPTGLAAARLARVANERGVVVTTGQQPGLFGGALMTLAKAISAMALADEIERCTGIPAAPLFWAATDDADFEEARSTAIATPDGLEILRLEHAPPAGTPMSHAPLGDVSSLLARLERACASGADADMLDAIRATYTSGATVGSAYVRLLREILPPLGMAVLDASHTCVRDAGAPILRGALHRAALVDEALRARAAELEQAGYTPQVDYTAGLSLVFDTIGEKQRLPIAEATQKAASVAVERLSPNVLLRPVLERAIVPTVAYVAGPGELAYFTQVSAVASALGAAPPLAVPRWSVTVVEPRVERLLARLRLEREALRDVHAVEGMLARAVLSPSVTGALRDLRRAVERGVGALEAADEDALVPQATLDGLRRTLLHRIERQERRYTAAVKRRETQLMRDVASLAAALYPKGKPQERVLAFAPFLVRYGRGLLGDLLREAGTHAARLVNGPSAPASLSAESAAYRG
jgi:bacillithiol synthase